MGDISRSRLRQIIREEAQKMNEYDESAWEANVDDYTDGLEKAYAALQRMGDDRLVNKNKRRIKAAYSDLAGGGSLR